MSASEREDGGGDGIHFDLRSLESQCMIRNGLMEGLGKMCMICELGTQPNIRPEDVSLQSLSAMVGCGQWRVAACGRPRGPRLQALFRHNWSRFGWELGRGATHLDRQPVPTSSSPNPRYRPWWFRSIGDLSCEVYVEIKVQVELVDLRSVDKHLRVEVCNDPEGGCPRDFFGRLSRAAGHGTG